MANKFKVNDYIIYKWKPFDDCTDSIWLGIILTIDKEITYITWLASTKKVNLNNTNYIDNLMSTRTIERDSFICNNLKLAKLLYL